MAQPPSKAQAEEASASRYCLHLSLFHLLVFSPNRAVTALILLQGELFFKPVYVQFMYSLCNACVHFNNHTHLKVYTHVKLALKCRYKTFSASPRVGPLPLQAIPASLLAAGGRRPAVCHYRLVVSQEEQFYISFFFFYFQP